MYPNTVFVGIPSNECPLQLMYNILNRLIAALLVTRSLASADHTVLQHGTIQEILVIFYACIEIIISIVVINKQVFVSSFLYYGIGLVHIVTVSA